MGKIYNWKSLTRVKPVAKSLSQNTSEASLKLYDLMAYGVSATVGTGIYASVGRAAANTSGPAVVVSTMISGLISLMTAFSYLEFASKIPTSGSSFVYAYSSLGELAAWFIGWNLTLEYSFAAAAIAGAWSSSFAAFFINLGVKFPEYLTNIDLAPPYLQLNVLGCILVLLVGLLLMRGLKSSALFTNAMTVLNILIILFIIFAGSAYTKSENITANFAPFGFRGIIQGSILMFFAYIGFDTVCTLSADAKKPKRDVPIAVIATIALATSLYVAVGLVLTGMVKYTEIDMNTPLASAFMSVNASWASHIVLICALTTMLSTLFACLMGQPKIFAAMALDGLFPPSFHKLNKREVPMGSLLFTIGLTAVLVLFVNMDTIVDMVSVGCLFGFSSISAGLLVLRFKGHPSLSIMGPQLVLLYFIGTIATSMLYSHSVNLFIVISVGVVTAFAYAGIQFLFIKFSKDLTCKTLGGFVCPLVPMLPCLSILVNNYVMSECEPQSFLQFLVWTALGLIIYFAYGIRNSKLGKECKLYSEQELH